MPGDDFVETAFVMREAGITLMTMQPRSACYLLGYVAECVLKAAAVAALTAPSGLAMGASDAQKRVVAMSHDVERLSNLHRVLALTPSARSHRLAPLDRLAPTISRIVPPGTGGGKNEQHWDPNHRYDGARWDAPTAAAYAAEADRLIILLVNLQLDGAL